jgi:YaeC family lipoprotein
MTNTATRPGGRITPRAARWALTILTALTLLGVGTAWAVRGSSSAAPARTSLKVGVVGGPEAEVLAFVADQEPNLGLELVRFPNAARAREALRSREVDAASFESQVELVSSGQEFESAGLTVTLPLAFYSRRLRSLSELGEGSRVAISRAPLAQGRALLVLYHYGLVGFDEALGPSARLPDVTRNPRGIELVAVDDAALPAELDGAQLVALEYGPAAAAGLAPARRGLAMEDAYSPFAQVLTVLRGGREDPKVLALLTAYHSTGTKSFILNRFEDSVRRPW